MESPIFFDATGKRWRGIKYTLLFLCLSLLILSMWAGREARTLASVPSFEASAAPERIAADDINLPMELAYRIDAKTLPIIGYGSLLRVVELTKGVDGLTVYDPFTGEPIRRLSEEEANLVGSREYAIERYGQTNGKRLTLTFDDGPDPTFTPLILDLLGKENVPSTFFVVGTNVVKYPDLAQRIVREGHIVGNHTFTHIDFDFVSPLRAREELNSASRAIQAVTGQYTSYFRLPYGGDDDDSIRDNIRGILHAQQLGYVVTSYDIDTNDWEFQNGSTVPLPELDGGDHILLLHDAGGDRSATIEYLSRLISAARAQGYQFTTLNSLYPNTPSLTGPAPRATADAVTVFIAKLLLVTPSVLMRFLFILSVSTLLAAASLHLLLAILQGRLQPSRRRRKNFYPLVSVIVPAYNEEKVLEKTVRSLLRSRYQNIEILIIDDGSTDNTADVIRSLSRLPRVRAIQQKNGGKASALNHGLEKARGEIVVTLDADTIFTRSTIGKLIKHFSDPTIGAVAGVVKVGNPHNILTAWQALEYINGISVDRRAQSLIGAITIVPGACAAWRKSAILAAGGHSGVTLAEDCDLTLAIHKAGYRIIQENQAIAYTEAPQTLRSLAKQRFRWTFGNLQAFWKHRDMLFKPQYGLLGMVILPYAALSIIIPLLFLPFIYALTVKAIVEGQISAVMFYFMIFAVTHFLTTVVGLVLARERWAHVLIIPLYRVIYEPLRTYLLYASFFTALKGSSVRWGTVPRTGTARAERRLLKPALTNLGT